jgi:hypothetical protein
VQHCCTEIGAEVAAVPPDGPVIHQPVLEEYILPVADISSAKYDGAGSIDDALRNRRSVLICRESQQDEDGKAEGRT